MSLSRKERRWTESGQGTDALVWLRCRGSRLLVVTGGEDPRRISGINCNDHLLIGNVVMLRVRRQVQPTRESPLSIEEALRSVSSLRVGCEHHAEGHRLSAQRLAEEVRRAEGQSRPLSLAPHALL